MASKLLTRSPLLSLQRVKSASSPIVGAAARYSSTGQPATINSAVAKAVSTFEYQDAFRSPTENFRWTFLELKRQFDGLGAGLSGVNLTNTNIVSLVGDNSPENPVIFFATLRAGAQFHGVSTPGSLAQALAGSSGVFVNPEDESLRTPLEALVPEMLEAQLAEMVTPKNFPQLQFLFSTGQRYIRGYVALRDMMSYSPIPDPLKGVPEALPTAPAVRYDAGRPITQKFFVDVARGLAKNLDINNQNRVVLHANGAVSHATFLASVISGGMVVLPAAKFDPVSTLKAIHDEHGNVLQLSSAQLKALIEEPTRKRYDLSSLKTVAVTDDGSTAPAFFTQVKAEFKVSRVVALQPDNSSIVAQTASF